MITLGNEDVVGADMVMSNQAMSYTAIVQVLGQIYRLPKAPFMDEFNRCEVLYQKLLGYTLTLPAQTASGAIFSHHHKIDPQSGGSLLQ